MIGIILFVNNWENWKEEIAWLWWGRCGPQIDVVVLFLGLLIY
jgi:hypothetical protein